VDNNKEKNKDKYPYFHSKEVEKIYKVGSFISFFCEHQTIT